MRAARRSLVLIACMVVAGCERRDKLASPDTTAVTPPIEQRERSAYISVSDLAPRSGDTIVVAGTLGVGAVTSLGSFRVRLEYDTTRLAFVGEVPLPGMLRVTNPRADAVIVAGASSDASSDGRMFALRFRVLNPTGVESLILKIDELNDASFASTAQSVTRSSRIVLDSALVRGKGKSQ